MEPVEALPERRILLIKPPFPVPTAWAYKRYAEMACSLSTVPGGEQWLEKIQLINDLEVPVFDKYLLLPVMKEWLRQQPGVESAFMTGSGSTMVAIFSPGATAEALDALKEKIVEEFGSTMWVTATGWEKLKVKG